MSQSNSKLTKLIQSRYFWISAATITSLGLIFGEWYRDAYATPEERYNRIKPDYTLTIKQMHKIRKEFVSQMIKKLDNKKTGNHDKPIISTKSVKPSDYGMDYRSCIKMLSSKIEKYPNGNENGLYYSLDWGGTNFRILRIKFNGKNTPPQTISTSIKIPNKYLITSNYKELFDYLNNYLKQFIIKNKDNTNDNPIKIGFTFSFPMIKKSLKDGYLCEWTKGYKISNTENKNITNIMNESFKRIGINGEIKVICCDTTATLMAGKYYNENCRIGLILGTGNNAGYIEPNGNELINIEWGGFNSLLLPRMPIDFIMDKYTPNKGKQYTEKIIGGYYIGELVRLLSIEVFRDKIIINNNKFNNEWGVSTEDISTIITSYNNNNFNKINDILQNKYKLNNFTIKDIEIFYNICILILYRSADLGATMLLGALEKTGLYKCYRNDDRNPFENDTFKLTKKYKNNTQLNVVVAVDGSLYEYAPGYKERINYTIKNVVGEEIADRIDIKLQKDGSLFGPACAVAALDSN